ncbi:MAG: site-specific integrase [Oscillospiraceae bacterium]|nr:site-specific integrase [Oscillospiraceae bacterium]
MANIRKRGNTYQVDVLEGRTADGKRIRRTATFTPEPTMTPKQIEKALNKFVVNFEEQVKQGLYQDGKIKFQEYAEHWLETTVKRSNKHRTHITYEDILKKRIYPVLGHLRLEDIRPAHIKALLRDWEENATNAKTGTPLSGKTLNNYFRVLSSLFSCAVEDGRLNNNPCKNVAAPKFKQKRVEYLQDIHVPIFLEMVDNAADDNAVTDFPLAIKILLFSGLRRGELLGLTWSAVDFNKGQIDISTTSLYAPDRGIYAETPKTDKSARIVKLPAELISMLENYRATQKEIAAKYGDKWNNNAGYIFTQKYGEPLHPDTLTGWLRKRLMRHNAKMKELGETDKILPMVSPHDLRHTHASLLISENTNIRTISSRLGHAAVTTTLNTYSHEIKSAEIAAVELLESKYLRKHVQKTTPPN